MILCKLSHIRLSRQGVLVRRRAGYEKQSLSDRLKDKVALVSDAGSRGPGWGNGKATAVLFAREGTKVLAAADIDLVLPPRD